MAELEVNCAEMLRSFHHERANRGVVAPDVAVAAGDVGAPCHAPTDGHINDDAEEATALDVRVAMAMAADSEAHAAIATQEELATSVGRAEMAMEEEDDAMEPTAPDAAGRGMEPDEEEEEATMLDVSMRVAAVATVP